MTRVVIVGGGIGGLAAAAALRRDGHEPIVLERAPEIRALGAGISLAPNAMRALEQLGLADTVRARAAEAQWMAILNSRGETLQRLPGDLVRAGVAVHRADLQEALLHGEERLGHEVAEVHADGGVVLKDGEELQAELVIGADGIHSLARRAILPESRPRYAGYTAWRAVAPVAVEAGRLTESWGRGARFGLADIGGGRTYWFATKNAPEGGSDGGKTDLLERFGDWHEPVCAMIEATAEEEILRNDVYHLEPLPRWSEGRLTLLGDAAHAATPGLGQGAAQALEDALVLAGSLREHSALEAALQAYEAARRPRTRALHALARRADRVAQLDSRLLCAVRNALVRRLPERAQRRQYRTVVETAL